MRMLRRLLLLAATLATALMAGFFFAFDVTVLPALDALPAGEAIKAMQAINEVVRNPFFGAAFFGAPVLTGFALFAGRAWIRDAALFFILAACLCSLVTFAVTFFFNVPLNRSLATVDPASADAANLALEFFRPWGEWNLVRTLASSAATLFLALSWYCEGVRTGRENKHLPPAREIVLARVPPEGEVRV